MKILYITTVRMPTEKAHGIQIMHMCAAFAAHAQVDLITPHRENHIKVDPFEYYGVPKTFRIRHIASLDFVKFGRVGFWLHRLTFACSAAFVFLRSPSDVVYSRDELIAWVAGIMGKHVVLELHEGRWNPLVRAAARRAQKVVVITHALADFFSERGVPATKLLVAADGVDLARFAVSDRVRARAALGIEEGQIVVMYTGHLYSWKGADTLARAASLVPRALFVFIGGTDGDIARFRRTYGSMHNVRIIGRKQPVEIPTLLSAADVLVLPNSAREAISRLYTSPMKLFEYMAAGRPIVASDLPSIREILDEQTALFFEADNPEYLARAIEQTLADPGVSGERAHTALARVRAYSWTARAESILQNLA